MIEKAFDMAVAQAAKAFDHWEKTSHAERAKQQNHPVSNGCRGSLCRRYLPARPANGPKDVYGPA